MVESNTHGGHVEGAEQAVDETQELRNALRLTPLSQSGWEEDTEGKPRKKSRVKSAAFLAVLGILSFFFFLYLTFPYGVIKEVASVKITEQIQASGYPVSVRIGALKPYWFTGLELNNVVVKNVSDPTAVVKLGEVITRVSVLPLFIGRLSVSTRVTQAGGSLELDAKIPISSLIKGAPNPRMIEVNLKNFAIDGFFNHLLAIPKASKDPAMILVQPILSKTTAGGSLTGRMAFENIDKMTGAINLNLVNLFLHINDETLKIPQQNFSTAKIDIKYQNNTLIFNDTKLEAPDIGIALSGNISLPESRNAVAEANLDMTLTMHGAIEKSLGMIVPNLMRCKPLANGELKAKLQGPLTQMTCI